MNVGLVDCELIYNRPKFPNLATMKLSAYHKARGDSVHLITMPIEIFSGDYDVCYFSKVFTATDCPDAPDGMKKIYGGTGFDSYIPLPDDVYYSVPDYSIYDCVKDRNKNYTDYSLGRLTRGCFRKCPFCVNRFYDRVSLDAQNENHIFDFVDVHKKIMLIDDNFFGYHDADRLLNMIIDLDKRFVFKQGLDLRLLTPARAKLLEKSKYDLPVIFAFDNINDVDIIEKKLKVYRQYCTKQTEIYLLCRYYSNNDRDEIESIFKRLMIIAPYNCCGYIMRYQTPEKSPYESLYNSIATYFNTFIYIKKMSFEDFIDKYNRNNSNHTPLYKQQYLKFIERHPDMRHYFTKNYYNNNTETGGNDNHGKK